MTSLSALFLLQQSDSGGVAGAVAGPVLEFGLHRLGPSVEWRAIFPVIVPRQAQVRQVAPDVRAPVRGYHSTRPL